MFWDLASISWLMSTKPELLNFTHFGPISINHCFDSKMVSFPGSTLTVIQAAQGNGWKTSRLRCRVL